MSDRIEWRTRGKGKDAIVYVGQFGEDENTVLRVWKANAKSVADFLNDMATFDTKVEGLEVPVDQRDPDDWGRVVLVRGPREGEVRFIEPDLYWDLIYYWFRSHGKDPHPWSAHHKR
jgi:hypothetical protein